MTEMKVAHSYKTYEPMSMLPADGWRAVFAYYDDEKGYVHTGPLVVFALTKVHHVDVYGNGHETTSEEIRIVGYTAVDIGIHPAEESHNFIGYLAPGKRIPDHMEQRAKEYVLANSTDGTVGTPNEESANWLSLWLEDLENYSGRIPVHGPVIIQEKENTMEAHSVGMFVQVGETAINLALVARITFGTKYVHLYYSSCEGSELSASTILGGGARLAFLDWWEHQAVITQDAQLSQFPPLPLGTSE